MATAEEKAIDAERNRLRRREARKRRDAEKAKERAFAEAALELAEQLQLLAQRTKGNPTDADGDIDFAYHHMALPSVKPLEAPSTAAWQWYIFARRDSDEFLKICAKREDAKAKMAGTITNQRMEDDKRQQFAVIERLKKELTMDVAAIIKELMEAYPEDVLRECRKFDAQWKAFLAKEPI